MTESRVADLFAVRGVGRVTRYALPTLHALNFVLDDVLEGGVNSGLNLDTHGKTNSFRLLAMTVSAPAELAQRARQSPGP